MSEMRREMNGLKRAVADLDARVVGLDARVGGLADRVTGLDERVTGLTDRVGSLEGAVGQLAERTGRVETTLGKVVVTVAGFADRFDRIEEQLTILPRLEKFMNSYDFMASELLAMRSDRLLMSRSFSDQQAVLGDHEVRLTRLERREKKPS